MNPQERGNEQSLEKEKALRLEFLNYLLFILKSKIERCIDIVLDSNLNKEILLSYPQSSLESLFEKSNVFGHCLHINLMSKNSSMHVRTYEKGKSERPFETMLVY